MYVCASVYSEGNATERQLRAKLQSQCPAGYLLLNGLTFEGNIIGSVCDAQLRCSCCVRLVALYIASVFLTEFQALQRQVQRRHLLRRTMCPCRRRRYATVPTS